MREGLSSALANAGVKLYDSQEEGKKPHYTSPETLFVKNLIDAYQSQTGRTESCCAIGGGTYVNGIEGGVAFGAMLPDEPHTNAHAGNEFTNVDNLLLAGKVFAKAILLICS